MSIINDLLESFEVHSPKGIREALNTGASPIEPIRGKKPIESLIEMYTRSPRFGECLRVMLAPGRLSMIRCSRQCYSTMMLAFAAF